MWKSRGCGTGVLNQIPHGENFFPGIFPYIQITIIKPPTKPTAVKSVKCMVKKDVLFPTSCANFVALKV